MNKLSSIPIVSKESFYKKVNEKRMIQICKIIKFNLGKSIEIDLEWIKEYNELIKKL